MIGSANVCKRFFFASVIVASIVGAGSLSWRALAQRRGGVDRGVSNLAPDALSANGDLDQGFWSGQASIPKGVARVAFGTSPTFPSTERSDVAQGVVIQSTGKVVVGGASSDPLNNTQANQQYNLARFSTDGTLDTTFGTSGRVAAKFVVGQGDAVSDIAVDPFAGTQQDFIYVVGSTTGATGCGGGASDLAVARYTADGSLDTTWNTGGLNGTGGQSGKYIKDFKNCTDIATRVVVLPDHGVLILAEVRQQNGFNQDAFIDLIRLDSLGLPVTTFNGGSGLPNPTGTVEHVATTLNVNPFTDIKAIPAPLADNGKFVAFGISPGASQDFLFMRFNTDGSKDTSFGTSGRTTVPITGGSVTGAKSLAIQPADGKILGAGTTIDSKFALARLTSGGTLDAGFPVIQAFPAPVTSVDARSVSVMTNGKIIVSGNGSVGGIPGSSGVAIARFNTNGTLDTTFGGSPAAGLVYAVLGSNNASVTSGTLNSLNRIFVAGQIQATGGGGDGDFYVAKFINASLTASNVIVSGRIMTNDGRGLTNAQVRLSDPSGETQIVITGRNGVFTFDNVEPGRTYVISIASMRFSYSPQTVTVTGNVSDLMFVP